MIRTTWARGVSLVAAAWTLLASQALADDSAASIAVGGLVPRRETRIVMAKEVLRISAKKVVVDYDFRNDTNEDVTTEVAFPIPPYGEGPEEFPAAMSSFSSFRVEVDGKPVAVSAEARALLGGKDVTQALIADKIDIVSFGHHDWDAGGIRDFDRLSKAEQERLVKLGLFDLETPMGTWTVHLQYRWTQRFPAHSTIHIRHEYAAVVGYQLMGLNTIRLALQDQAKRDRSTLDPEQTNDQKQLASFCTEIPLLRLVDSRLAATGSKKDGHYVNLSWVDFILTSANTWKQPIEDFTLIIERPTPDQKSQTLLSFCSPAEGKIEKIDADHFQVHLTDFVPASELRIGFFEVPEPQTPKAKTQPR